MALQVPSKTTTYLPGFTIRKANIEDISTIIDFIRQLAVYERMLNEVIADEDTVAEYLFCENPFAHVVFGEYNGTPVGFALFFTNFSTFLGRPGIFLEDLFVKPEYRGKGFGKSLLAFLALLAANNNFGRVEWSVLNWNEPAITFYKKLGAIPMNEWTVFRLTGDSIKTLAKQV